MYVDTMVSRGQQEARTRWGTHASGAEFDRKKRTFLTDEAREFLSEQVMCVIVGPDPEQRPCSILLVGQPGFIETPDECICLIPVDRSHEGTSLLRGIDMALTDGATPRLALCCVQHVTRQRICVQGTVEIISAPSPDIVWLRLHVNLAFFHCPKYVRTKVEGLHVPLDNRSSFSDEWKEDSLTADLRAFLSRQVLCYLCTVDQHGQYAINHRGGAAGFLVTLEPDRLTPGGVVLLPDYAGNGAFEAIGNILETGKMALLVPGYAEQLAFCLTGAAAVLEPGQLPDFLRMQCRGAQRVIAMTVQYVEQQTGDWTAALAYEQARVKVLAEARQALQSCPV